MAVYDFAVCASCGQVVGAGVPHKCPAMRDGVNMADDFEASADEIAAVPLSAWASYMPEIKRLLNGGQGKGSA